MNIRKYYETLLALFAVAALLLVAQPKPAQAEDYDMDCAVILCLAGGFPTGCSAAYSYMIDRITSTPPKPPFGFCAMGSLSDVDFPDNDDPLAHEAMIAVIDDPGVARTLRSVRAEISRGHSTCQQGGDGDSFRCTSMIEMNGDGSQLFMGRRGSQYSEFWRRGKRVTFLDYEGTPQSTGDAEHYTFQQRICENYRQDNCRDVYEWRSIAQPAGTNEATLVPPIE